MERHRFPGPGAGGFSAVELIVVIAIIGVTAVVSIPTLITYQRASALKAAAEEVASALSRARQLAVAENRSVCFQVNANRYQYTYGCAGAAVFVPGADANGFFRLANDAVITNGGANPVFDYVGAASVPGTLTVTYVSPSGALGAQRTVAVSGSGRIQIQ